MPFPIVTAVAIFITIWWVTLFAVLPLGVRSVHESDDAPPAGTDPGAPVAPRLLMKAGLTTVISAILFIALVVIVRLTQ